jgi:hypothetical protein
MAKGYSLSPEGVAFDSPAGPLPMPLGPDAAAEMARRDAAAGVLRPLSDYQAMARREVGADNPAALAQAGGAGGAPAVPAPDAMPQPPERPLAWQPDAGPQTFSVPTPDPAEAPPPGAPVDPTRGGEIGSGGVNPYPQEAARERTEAGWSDRYQAPPSGAEANGTGPQTGAAGPARVDPSKVQTVGARQGASGGGGGGRAFGEARAAVDEAMRFQQGAGEATEASRKAADQRQADLTREQNAIDQTYQAGREARMADMAERSRRMEAHVDSVLEDASKMRVDPERWLSSRSTGQRILMALGGFFGGLAGKSGEVASEINGAIDRDVRAQIENRDAKLKQATVVQQVYRQYLDAFKDREEAFAATTAAAKLGIAKGAMAKALELGSPEQIAKAEEFHAKTLAEQSALMAQVAQNRAAAAAKAAGAGAPKKTGKVLGDEQAKVIYNQRQGADERAAAARRMKERDKKPFSSWTPSEIRADQADVERLASGTSRMRGEGVTNKDNMDRADKTFGQSMIGSRDKALDAVIEESNERRIEFTETLRRHGKDPDLDE